MVETKPNRANAHGACDDNKLHMKIKYTWQQVAEKNNEKEAWIIVRDKVYDVTGMYGRLVKKNYFEFLITEWLRKHPGGKEMLLLHAGRECTHTFDSYHPFSDKSSKVLEKFEIGCLVGEKEFPSYLPDSGFHKECQRRVAAYFVKNQLNPKDCLPGMVRMLSLFPVCLLSYLIMNGWLSSNIFVLLTFAVLHGCCVAIPLMHLVHV